ncbi:monovalent cation:H+ antiporter, CPA1 (nhx1) [Ceratocystis pirilliformis]|uniref:Sodium/hydrogen exchanger n=1 Tax=Ceratocystis pirilliformis TaxID=259994 RepID=A0ABR3YV29_9PEZI
MASQLAAGALHIFSRAIDDDADPGDGNSTQSEAISSWAIFISIMLLIAAFLTSYLLKEKKIEAIHETVISIFAGMVVGLILLITPGDSIRNIIKFSPQIFFNLLLPPIILSSGYELHQANFFRNIGIILTFAFAGTFLSAVVIGVILWLFAMLPGPLKMDFVDAISVGATLSATDPVTILAIFNSYKVDPTLYTYIFGESILNDAIAIVIFETAQKYKKGEAGNLGIISLFEGIGVFLFVFFGSMLIGVLVGVGTALLLKLTYIRRFQKIESSLVVLIAYASYFFSNGIHMSGIVSLLFCGITLKHYAYFNMSRRTQLTTKYLFQVLAQLSENFIFIYLGLSLFTDNTLVFQPPLIIVSVMAVCAARYVAVFPLSSLINRVIRYRAAKRGTVPEELSYSYQAMLFWAGLRGAVGVALAALMDGDNAPALRATVLVVVVLTVIIFGGTTARMLEILGIQTGVVDEIDSDDEFDIETFNSGLYKRSDTAIGYNPHRNVSLNTVRRAPGPSAGPSRLASSTSLSRTRSDNEQGELLHSSSLTDSEIGSDIDTSDLPPPARNNPTRRRSNPLLRSNTAPLESQVRSAESQATGVIPSFRQILTTEDPAGLFRQLDEGFIKPHLLLDSGNRRGSPSSSGGGPGV